MTAIEGEMNQTVQQLQNLQRSISKRNRDVSWVDEGEKLFFSETDGLFDVEFYGLPWDDSFIELSGLLCQQKIAALIRSLVFRGPDKGTNGTKNWRFTALLNNEVIFSELKYFFIEPTTPHHHNQSIVGESYEEAGMIACLTNVMPQLESLTVPSAPDKSFFAEFPKKLHRLRVEAGYDHQNFIQNLSESSSLPNLSFLDFGEYSQNYIENYQERCTPFAHFAELFQSPAFANVEYFRLRNPALSKDQLRELQRMRKDLQFHVVHELGYYVEHI